MGKAWLAENSNADKHFEELMAQEQWKRCPVCSAPSERESGCNFMQCRSDRCRKRTYWCYVCGKQFPKEMHYTHYPRGPYEDECYTPVEERLELGVTPSQPPDAEGGAREALNVGLDVVRGWFGAR